ncbi:hypothetical protein [Flexivirga oryzae]|uniref:Uncharacterized protein n=1 Tax=Flexivirga oryzae TaxID=1794944 RepID=A0A839N867_9MICO|nr:hypothetical protein [Flexivirga oryzae]MBB2893437.1 hypothetical protein [Flexivirga oryzae]
MPEELVPVWTWFVGSVVTTVGLSVLGFLLYYLCLGLRRRAKRAIRRATRGLDLEATERLVANYVKFDRWASAAQSRSGVGTSPTPAGSPSPFTKSGPGSRRARLLFRLLGALRWPVLVVKYLLTSLWGVLTLAATWWAMGAPGADSLDGWIRRLLTDHENWLSLSAVPVIAAGVAVLTFSFSRLRGARAIGHQSWRRNEAMLASASLADRQIEIAIALDELDDLLDRAHRRWYVALVDAQSDAERQSRCEEIKLRRVLGMPADFRSARPMWNHRTRIGTSNATDDVPLARLRAHLDSTSVRDETRIARAAPWRVVRVASRRRIRWTLADIDPLLADPASRVAISLTDVDLIARVGIQQRIGRIDLNDLSDFDSEQLSPEERESIVQDAKERWTAEIRQASDRGTDLAHRVLIDGLIGVAELAVASDTIFRYVHPTGPLTQLLERIWPA